MLKDMQRQANSRGKRASPVDVIYLDYVRTHAIWTNYAMHILYYVCMYIQTFVKYTLCIHMHTNS